MTPPFRCGVAKCGEVDQRNHVTRTPCRLLCRHCTFWRRGEHFRPSLTAVTSDILNRTHGPAQRWRQFISPSSSGDVRSRSIPIVSPSPLNGRNSHVIIRPPLATEGDTAEAESLESGACGWKVPRCPSRHGIGGANGHHAHGHSPGASCQEGTSLFRHSASTGDYRGGASCSPTLEE